MSRKYAAHPNKLNKMMGMGSMTECSDPSVQNKMAVTECLALRTCDTNKRLNKMEGMESMIDCSAPILDPSVNHEVEDGKLLCKQDCEECAEAAQSHRMLKGDNNLMFSKIQIGSRLNKMEGMESMTVCFAPILGPSVNHGAEDGKLCCLRKTDCVEGPEAAQSHRMLKGQNNLIFSQIQMRSRLNKMAGMVEKLGRLYYTCKRCGVLAYGAPSHHKQRDENNWMCSKIQIQPDLNKMKGMESLTDCSAPILDPSANHGVEDGKLLCKQDCKECAEAAQSHRMLKGDYDLVFSKIQIGSHLNKIMGMGSMTECSDPSVQNKMTVTECLALRIGDTNKRLNKMEGMESMTDCSAPILDPSVNHGVEDGKLLCKQNCEEYAEAAQSHRMLKGDNNMMCSKIQTRSHLNKMAGMGSLTECSDPSLQNPIFCPIFQNKMVGMESMTKFSAPILDLSVRLGVGDNGTLYCLCEPGRKTICEKCTKAVSCVIGDKNKRLNKMEGMESMTEFSAPIYVPSVNHGVNDDKLCCLRKLDCVEGPEAAQFHCMLNGQNNLMFIQIHMQSHLNKMAAMVEKFGKLYHTCKICGGLANHHKQRDENNLMCSEIRIQPQLNKMVVMESLPDWSGLLTDLVVEIAKKLSVVEDFAAFRGVCTSWRAAASKDKFVSESKLPLLMLAEKDGDVREFYSLCKRKIFTRMPVPEAKGKKCIGAGFGWILTMATSGSGELSLVKPMTSSKIILPNMKSFPEYEKYRTMPEQLFIGGQAVLSANPSETSEFLLTVCTNLRVGVWRNGDSHWTKIVESLGGLANICFYRRKIYGIRLDASIWMWDPYLTKAPEMLLTLHESWMNVLHLPYFVESSKGELLLIIRRSVYREDDPEEFSVLRIDTMKKDYDVIKCLDQDAIFVGQNCGVVSADDFPGVIKANCIYFTDDDCDFWPWPDSTYPTYTTDEEDGDEEDGDEEEHVDEEHVDEEHVDEEHGDEEEHDFEKPLPGSQMGIYNFEDDSIERFDVESYSFICPPFWIFPSLC